MRREQRAEASEWLTRHRIGLCVTICDAAEHLPFAKVDVAILPFREPAPSGGGELTMW